MIQKITITLLIMVIIAAAAVAVNLYLKSSSFQIQMEQSEQIAKKFEDDIKRLDNDKMQIVKENEKFQSDAVYYTKFTAQLQKELEEVKSSVEEKDERLDQLKEQLASLTDEMDKKAQTATVEQGELSKEHAQFKDKVTKLEETLRKERGVYYYNLGVTYVAAKLFNKAVNAYEKSLSFESENAEAQYNLGLLYENFNLEPEKAILHYEKYLELKPDAVDKDEVLKWINRLKDVVYQQIFPESEHSR